MNTFEDGFAEWTLQSRPIEKRSGHGHTWDKQALHFHVSVIAENGETWNGEYSVGSAWPIMAAKEAATQGQSVWERYRKQGGIRWPHVLAKDVRKLATHKTARTLHEADLIDRLRKMFRPKLADVMGSLFADASGIDVSVNFRDWCDDLGIEGNPADALESFQACQNAARFLARACGSNFEPLRELAAEL